MEIKVKCSEDLGKSLVKFNTDPITQHDVDNFIDSEEIQTALKDGRCKITHTVAIKKRDENN